ncbi:hypothetical protein O181_004534 [Austropuccinia psidii MF-1]|uniref:Uncharacterized protein n=1 Tax=Austropuccinia psidii MF-1 TaxID=1389203 RepID=A0A9Q3BG02_9BASI|nr:hypothetical protein [Austropuccinia psidii MF-1]
MLKEFRIKDVGPAYLILGIKVSLDQHHFTKSLLELHGIIEFNLVSSPLVPNEHLALALVDKISKFGQLKVSFHSAAGSINYLSTATRRGLSFAVSALSQHLESPGILHWKIFLHVLNYFKGTQDAGLNYPKNINVGILAYSDSHWRNCDISHRSVTGLLATVWGRPGSSPLSHSPLLRQSTRLSFD